ncbi:MAG: pitrilysin family protein [Phototrophicales bacterium]|nr:pitrilysin family protein [Phototrophicales bacterium]
MMQTLPNTKTITRDILPNGLRVLIYETPHTHSVVISGSVEAGSLFESPAKSGMVSMLASSLMRGTHKYDFNALHNTLEDMGANLGMSSGVHKIGFHGKALAEDLPVLLELLSEALRHPTFPTEEIERLRGERLTWLNYRQQDTGWLAARSIREGLYPDLHPYHYANTGTLDTIPTISIDDIRDYHATHFGAQDMVLVIVGSVDSAQALATVRQYFADWDNPHQPIPPELPALISQQPHYDRMKVAGKSQADLIMATLGPSRYAPDYHAAVVANGVLGQFGMMGRIGEVVREREGMAYHVSSRVDGGYGPGAWRIVAGVHPDNVDKTIALCRAELARLVNEPVTADELRDFQSYTTGRLPLQLETNEGIANSIHTMEGYGYGLDYLMNYREMIDVITADDALKAAQAYINPDNLVIAVAGA